MTDQSTKKTYKNKTSLISFSSYTSSNETLENSNNYTASPNNIFFWIKFGADDQSRNILPVIGDG